MKVTEIYNVERERCLICGEVYTVENFKFGDFNCCRRCWRRRYLKRKNFRLKNPAQKVF